ncbi:MAG: hypothetical protein RLZZ179_2031 [Verrucomicrobiota bacterium]|jgi:hypothetical protein
MKPAEFEEKDFEGPLYRELLCVNHRIATPGQVFENAFGIDALMEADHPLFWDIFGYSDVPRGIFLNHYRWGWVWRRYGGNRTLPTFQVNLLIQAKRPDHLLGKNSSLARNGIKGSYWRFGIRAHQQVLLEQLERRLRNRALVVYAAPAFHELNSLYNHTANQTIVENSSFVRPSRMADHHHWNYERAGSVGVATSKPEAINDADFHSQLEQKVSASESVDPKEALRLLEKQIDFLVSYNQENPIARYYRRVEEEKWSRVEEFFRQRGALLSFLKISMFFDLLDTQWLVAGRSSEQEPASSETKILHPIKN